MTGLFPSCVFVERFRCLFFTCSTSVFLTFSSVHPAWPPIRFSKTVSRFGAVGVGGVGAVGDAGGVGDVGDIDDVGVVCDVGVVISGVW